MSLFDAMACGRGTGLSAGGCPDLGSCSAKVLSGW